MSAQEHLSAPEVQARTAARPLSVRDAADPISAVTWLQRSAGNQAVLSMLRTAPPPPPPITIQRYQAGEQGHGGIEERALTSIGFSDVEVSEIYFGNWLRDFSQLNSSGDPMAHNDVLSLYTVIEILGWGEFNRAVSPDELGTYVPSEHLDNPNAGALGPGVPDDKATIEDPNIQALASLPAGDPRRKPFEDAFAKLSPEQQAAYNSEEAHRAEITEAAKKSGLPEYIERGKFHAKEELKAAITTGRVPDGLLKMGNALHAVEDYLSHSNFVEVALWTLHNDGVAAADPYVKSMIEHMHGTNPALVGGLGPSGQPNIVTGTYSPGANDWVSRLELLKAQLHSGEFAKAFVIGLIRMGTVKVADIAAFLGAAGVGTLAAGIGAVAGGVGGAVSGAVSGAGSGAEQGWDEGSSGGYRSGYAAGGGGAVGEVLGEAEGALEGAVGAVTGLFGGAVSGGAHGAVSGAEAGGAYGASVGGAAGAAAGRAVVTAEGQLLLTSAEITMLLAAPFIQAAMAANLTIIDQIIDHYSDKETAESGTEAKARGLPGPTHSEIAKDAPDHPLFDVSNALAEQADKEIGTAMQTAWAARPAGGSSGTPGGGPDNGAAGGAAAGGTTAPPVTDEDALPVTSLVDKFVSQPGSDAWWRPVLTGKLGP